MGTVTRQQAVVIVRLHYYLCSQGLPPLTSFFFMKAHTTLRTLATAHCVPLLCPEELDHHACLHGHLSTWTGLAKPLWTKRGEMLSMTTIIFRQKLAMNLMIPI
jgi:hypothetical protein